MTDTLEAPPSFTLPADFDFGAPGDTSDDDLTPALPRTCEYPGCENEVVKTSAKGPAPKFCPEHRSSNRDAAPRTPGGRRTKWAKGAAVEANLVAGLQFVAGAGVVLPIGSPLYNDADALGTYGPAIIHQLVILAGDDKRLQGVLERLSAPGKYGPLVGACSVLVFAIAANHGLLPAALTGLLNRNAPTNPPTGGEL